MGAWTVGATDDSPLRFDPARAPTRAFSCTTAMKTHYHHHHHPVAATCDESGATFYGAGGVRITDRVRILGVNHTLRAGRLRYGQAPAKTPRNGSPAPAGRKGGPFTQAIHVEWMPNPVMQ